VVSVTTYATPPQLEGMSARLNNLQLMALAPSAALSATDPRAMALAVQRYKALKRIAPDVALDQVTPVLTADHDTI
jgi:hypothetical protein